MAKQPAQLGQPASLQPSEPPDQASPLVLASPLVSLLASPWQPLTSLANLLDSPWRPASWPAPAGPLASPLASSWDWPPGRPGLGTQNENRVDSFQKTRLRSYATDPDRSFDRPRPVH